MQNYFKNFTSKVFNSKEDGTGRFFKVWNYLTFQKFEIVISFRISIVTQTSNIFLVQNTFVNPRLLKY